MAEVKAVEFDESASTREPRLAELGAVFLRPFTPVPLFLESLPWALKLWAQSL